MLPDGVLLAILISVWRKKNSQKGPWSVAIDGARVSKTELPSYPVADSSSPDPDPDLNPILVLARITYPFVGTKVVSNSIKTLSNKYLWPILRSRPSPINHSSCGFSPEPIHVQLLPTYCRPPQDRLVVTWGIRHDAVWMRVQHTDSISSNLI